MKRNGENTRVLLVYPEYPPTFWSFKHILRFVRKKSAFPPLGLLTVAALLPSSWEKRLVDENVTALRDRDLKWADYLFIGGMIVQTEAIKKIIKRAESFNLKIVAGGPVFTTNHEGFDGVDHFVLNEAEITLPLFLEDLARGEAKKIYTSSERPDITKTPIPLWDLIDMKDYATMAVQYSRGCPFDCEFCDIVVMNGRKPRTKTTRQMLGELRALYKKGWKGALFIVDDNFIGNKDRVKELFSSLVGWVKRRKYPFSFLTEASVNLADDEELLRGMRESGFSQVFVGIETPVEESLAECNKFQNKKTDLSKAIKKIQAAGIEVMGGFIVGFDSDPPTIFERQVKFIQETGIVTAMLGILTALPGTKLYKRLQREGRLLEATTGNNTDGCINFVPKMDFSVLKKGYKETLQKIYSPGFYYERIINFLKSYKSVEKTRLSFSDIRAFLLSIWSLGVVSPARRYYWKLFLLSFFRYPKAFAKVITLMIYGYHFRKIAGVVR